MSWEQNGAATRPSLPYTSPSLLTYWYFTRFLQPLRMRCFGLRHFGFLCRDKPILILVQLLVQR